MYIAAYFIIPNNNLISVLKTQKVLISELYYMIQGDSKRIPHRRKSMFIKINAI